MDTSVMVGGAHAYALQHALLVYGDGRRAFVTLHDPQPAPDGTAGAPVLGPGRPVTSAFVKALTKQLGTSVPAEVLPPEVLVRTSDVTVWWRRPSVAPLFYKPKLAGDAAAAGAPDLAALSGALVPHPALVFRATKHGLWVRALDADARPTAETPIFTAPYWNVGVTGSVCLGSMRRPQGRGLAALAEWERAFFESEFTHLLPGVLPVRHAGGFAGLWTELAAQVRGDVVRARAGLVGFPPDALAPAPKGQTLGAFAADNGGGDW